jgi:putative tryptophan/tyrosine transport system substrate-binding protein
MKRRDFIKLFGGAAAWPSAVHSQQSGKPIVGYLRFTPVDVFPHAYQAILQGFAETGFVEGQSVASLSSIDRPTFNPIGCPYWLPS